MEKGIQNITFDSEKGICKPLHTNGSSNNVIVELEGLNLLMMRALLSNRTKAMTLEMLSETVWKRDHVSEDTIAKRISLLRAALSPITGSDNIIRTLPNRQYELVGPIEEIITPMGAEVSISKQLPPISLFKPQTLLFITVVIIAVLGGAYIIYNQSNPTILKDLGTGLELVAPS